MGLCNYDMPTTRHSVGLKAIDKLAVKYGVSWTRQRKLDGYLSDPVVRDNMEILLLKSRIPMNLNGKSVQKAGIVTINRFITERKSQVLCYTNKREILPVFLIKNHLITASLITYLRYVYTA